MSNDTKDMILGWALIGLSSIGVYAICKEIKDAYFKHRILEHGKKLEEIGNRLADLHKEGTECKEEESQ